MIRTIILLSVSILLVFACNQKDNSVPPKDDTALAIYKYNGSLQCDLTFDTQASISEMRLELVNKGIDVIDNTCGNDGLNHLAACGEDTGNINVFYIHPQNLDDVATLGYGKLEDLEHAKLFDCPQKNEVPPTTVDIYKHDGSLQCDESFDKQGSINTMLNELTNANIDVFETSCGNDGLNYAAVCGGGTGNINIFSIDAQKIADTKALGYDELQYLENPTFHSCPPL
jgi:hypothetical protein